MYTDGTQRLSQDDGCRSEHLGATRGGCPVKRVQLCSPKMSTHLLMMYRRQNLPNNDAGKAKILAPTLRVPSHKDKNIECHFFGRVCANAVTFDVLCDNICC